MENPGFPVEEADGGLSTRRGTGVGVITADCIPVLLASTDGRAVGAVHAGWRGIAGGILESAVERLAKLSPDQRLVAALGPGAGGCCYEVGAEVHEAISGAGRGRALLDLRACARERLIGAGLAASEVEIVGPCTICSEAWPSYRREGESAGRALAWVFPA